MDQNWVVVGATVAAPIVSAVSIIVFARYTKKQIGALTKLENERYEWERRRAAIDFTLVEIENARDAFYKLNRAFGPMLERKAPIPYSEMHAKFERDPDTYSSLIVFVSYYEHIAISIYQNIADEWMAFTALGSVVTGYEHLLSEFIEEREKESPDSYKNFKELAKDWRKVEKAPSEKRQQVLENLRKKASPQTQRITLPD